MRRFVVVLVALIIVAAAVHVGTQRLLLQPVTEPTPAALGSDARSSAIRCQGRVIPRQWLTLRFAASGRVAAIRVREGATVKAGDLLAELQPEDTSLELRAAEQRLLTAQAQLAQAQATPVPQVVRAAEAQVAAARARLAALKAGPTPSELEQARLRVDQAKNSLWAAQASRDAIGGNPHAGAALDEANARVASAEIAVRLAELSYEALKAGPSAEAVASAEAALAQAEANLRGLLAGPTPEELAILKAGVAQAQIALDQVRERGTRAEADRRLLAPFAGVVTAIAVQEGQAVTPATDVLVLADTSELLIETIDLTELDIGAVRLEQPVEIVIPGFGNPILQGRVSYISPQGTVAPSGPVTYRVLISLSRQEAALRWGMTAHVSLGRRSR